MPALTVNKNVQFQNLGNPGFTVSNWTTFPYPYNDSAPSGVDADIDSKILNWSGNGIDFAAAGVRPGDFIFTTDSSEPFRMIQVESVPSANQITLMDAVAEDFVNYSVFFIRPQFCRVEILFVPSIATEILFIEGDQVSANASLSSFNFVWEKGADSHSALRNLLAPIALEISSIGSAGVYGTGTKY